MKSFFFQSTGYMVNKNSTTSKWRFVLTVQWALAGRHGTRQTVDQLIRQTFITFRITYLPQTNQRSAIVLKMSKDMNISDQSSDYIVLVPSVAYIYGSWGFSGICITNNHKH